MGCYPCKLKEIDHARWPSAKRSESRTQTEQRPQTLDSHQWLFLLGGLILRYDGGMSLKMEEQICSNLGAEAGAYPEDLVSAYKNRIPSEG